MSLRERDTPALLYTLLDRDTPAAGSNAKAKEEAAVRKLACLAAKEDATEEAAGSQAKAKEAAAAEETADSLPCSAIESTLKMNRLKARSMD